MIPSACGTASSDPTSVQAEALRQSGGDDGGAGNESTSLPVDAIQRIIGADGRVSHGVLDITLDRDDIGDVSGPTEARVTRSRWRVKPEPP